jgi:hypothetical protein
MLHLSLNTLIFSVYPHLYRNSVLFINLLVDGKFDTKTVSKRPPPLS